MTSPSSPRFALGLVSPRFALALLALSALLAAPIPTSAADNAPAVRTAITNVYAGQSVIRFSNPRADAAATVTVDVYGVSDRAMIGRFQVEVPAMASVHVRAEERLQTFAPVNWDQLLVLYVSGSDGAQLWQHLRRNAVSGGLDNASVCGFSPAAAPGNLALNATLAHMYATAADAHESFISLHNLSDAAASYEARLFDADTGEAKGRVSVTLEAHGSFHQSSSWYQNNAGWYFPRPDQRHMNIVFTPTGAEDARDLLVGHVLMDVIAGDSVNLSNPCPIRAQTAAN